MGSESSGQPSRQRQDERVRRLVAGESLDNSAIAYDFDRNHLATIIVAPGAAEIARELFAAFDAQALVVGVDAATAWAWLGARRQLDPGEVEARLAGIDEDRMNAAIGEPGAALGGWRDSHRQAAVALRVAERRDASVVRYADVALLASVWQDDLLAPSLRRLYVEPLERGRDEGETAKRTLRAYFRAGLNASSAAAALGLSPRTVASRLAAIERRLGQPIAACMAELETALRVEELRAHR